MANSKSSGASREKSRKPAVSKFAAAAAKADPGDASSDDLDLGKYLVTLQGCHEAENGSFRFTFDGAGKDKKIGTRGVWISTTGKAVYVAQKVIKRLCMILAGETDRDGYDAFDPHGEFLDSIVKGELEAASEYLTDHDKADIADIESTEFYVSARKGGPKDDGSHFINADFSAAGEAEVDDEDDEPESERKPARKAKPAPSKRKPARDEEEDDSEDEEEDAPDSEADADDEDDAPDSVEPESEPAPRAAKKKARRK